MMGRRVVRRRRVVRAAAVGGVAYAAGRSRGRRLGEDEAYEQQAYEQQAYEEPETLGADTVQQLQQLAKLKEQGILTDEEFAEQKARILGG